MGRPRRYSPEVRERAVRLVFDHEREYESQWAAMRSIAEKIGCTTETLRPWVRAAEREGVAVARCTVERLMRELGLQGAVRGRRFKTTITDDAAARPRDLVDRDVTATRPNELWVADFTYVATWRGYASVAFVIDPFACRIVGWRVAHTLRTDFVLDALEQALYERPLDDATALVHQSDRGVQTCRFATPSASPRPGSTLPLGVKATRMTMPSPRP